MAAESASRAPSSRLQTLPLAATALLALLHLPFPFTFDQAFALVGARALDGGATLYVDWWDIRQPGTFWFYWLAGRLFGFDELGIHLLELLWMGGAALVILSIARRMFSRAYLAALAPLLTVGMYYAWASPFELTEPEGLSMLPLALGLLVVVREGDVATRRPLVALWLLFGLAAACAALLKLLLLAIPATLASIAFALAIRSGRASVAEIATLRLLPAAVGFLAPLLAALWHFEARGALDELYWTTLVAPGLSAAEITRAAYYRLLTGGSRFLARWLPAVPLWWMALSSVRTQRHSPHMLLLLGWLAAATAAILVQRLHYSAYRFLLLVVPMGLLAIRGAEVALERFGSGSGPQARVSALLLLPLLLASAAPLGPKLLALYDAREGAGSFGARYREILWPPYGPALRAAAAISGPGARPGAAFVFGNPVILAYSGRAQAIPLRGTSLAFTLQRHWDAFPALLEQARPPYVYVGREVADAVRARSPGISELLAADYRVSWEDAYGRWYELAPVEPERSSLSFPGGP